MSEALRDLGSEGFRILSLGLKCLSGTFRIITLPFP